MNDNDVTEFSTEFLEVEAMLNCRTRCI